MLEQVNVFYEGWGERWQWGTLVSTTALTGRPLIVFEYSNEARQRGLELSSYKLPLQGPQLRRDFPDHQLHLPGPVYDALPDGWGMLLMDRLFKRRGLNPARIGALERLTYIGTQAMGAMSFEPVASEVSAPVKDIPLAQLAAEIQVLAPFVVPQRAAFTGWRTIRTLAAGSGELIASFALTEPEAGSDAASLRTTAIRDGDEPLVKGAILCANDLQTEDVEVPEWGGAVRVRSFTGRERDAFEASMVRGEGKDRKVDLTNMRARLVGLTVIDEGGQRLFTDEEVDLLGAKSGAALDRVFAIAQKLNGLSGADVEELTKNSSGVPSAVSISDSALPLDSNTLTISSQA